MLKESLKTGFCFGLASGVITTLGLMVGLSSGTQSKLVVIGGILTIAVADAFSDALGIHISEESENKHTPREIWASTIATFISKFVVALSFVLPVLLFSLNLAIMVSIGWGLLLLGLLSYRMGLGKGESPWKVVLEHLFIAIVVIVITHYVGVWIARIFGG